MVSCKLSVIIREMFGKTRFPLCVKQIPFPTGLCHIDMKTLLNIGQYYHREIYCVSKCMFRLP